MKLLTYECGGKEAVGVLDVKGEMIIPVFAVGLNYSCMNDLIVRATENELDVLRSASQAPPADVIPYAQVGKVSPIPEPRQDVICIGRNYMAHINEMKGTDAPSHAIYFSKRVNRAVPDGGEIDGHLHIDEQLDYEVELAVIIGKDARNVPASRVEDYIFGYTIINDITSRRLQRDHKQFYFGKSIDTFTPMGPWIVTKDEFSFQPELNIKSTVSGELRQNGNTREMIFNIPHIITELSSGITLKAGTIIATGSPSGVAIGFDPPRFLKPGDTVECEIEGIGRLSNNIKK